MSELQKPIQLFHVNHPAVWSDKPKLEIGDVLHIGDRWNSYFKHFEKPRTTTFTGAPADCSSMPTMKFLREFDRRDLPHPLVGREGIGAAHHFLKLARELLWESVRLAEFAMLPSRQRCLWCLDSLDEVQNWLGRFATLQRYQILRVGVSGTYHRADDEWLMDGTESISEAYDKARSYWGGGTTPSPKYEWLVDGRVEVLDIVRIVGEPW